MRRTRTSRATVLCAVLAAGALLLAGCGSDKPVAKPKPTPSSPLPTPSVVVPSGVDLTAPGTKLKLGRPAVVPYRPNKKRGSVLRLTVTKVKRASMGDFAAYVLDKRTSASTPYYVHVRVKNVGRGNVGGTDVPLWAVNKKSTLIHASSFTNDFKPCPSRSLPKHFGPHTKLTTCLVYLVPKHGRMVAVSFRPLQAFDPILWPGPFGSAHHKHHKAHHKHQHGKKKS